MNKKVLKTLEFYKILEMLKKHAGSSLAKERIEELAPITELLEIRKIQQETSEATSLLFRKGNISLEGIYDLRPALKRTEIGAILSAGDLLHVADTMRICRKVKNYCTPENKNEEYTLLQEKAESLIPLKKLEDEIYRCIISTEEIADDASPTLITIRRQIKDTHGRVREKLNEMIRSSRYEKMLQEAVVTMRGDRYCIPVKQEYRGQFKGMVHDQSASGSTLFIEPMAVVEMNNKLRELQGSEQAEIEKILSSLTLLVDADLTSIRSNLEIITEIDFIFAKAKLSIEMKGTEPIFNNEKYIDIRKGRHPLLDPKTVVPIDVHLGKSFTTLLITGPNTGGKTVSLKTLGLFTIMGQCGLHIPAADRSELGIFDEVFADIGDEQSIEQSLSTFSSHMTNIVYILNHVTRDSLVLFDELGAGTDPTEGAALATAILTKLHKWEVRTAATTHYAELKVYALTTDRVENASMEFDVETLSPTYHLLIGVPGKSNAFAISKRLGLSDEIIQAAREYISTEEMQFEDVITSLEENRKLAEIEKDKASQYRKQAESLTKNLEEEKEKMISQREQMLQKAREEARKILQQAKQEADHLIGEIHKAQIIADTEASKKAEEARGQIKSKLGNIEDEMARSVLPKNTMVKPPNVKQGDAVRITTLNQNGVVLQLPDKEGQVLVQAGIMKIKVHVSNLKLEEEPKTKGSKTKSSVTSSVRSKARSISAEVDVRGQLVEEALMTVDKYLDDSILSGMHQITIIHGKGTGALRSAIHGFLKKHKHVAGYRLGAFGEGEAGVTVVELK